MILTQGIWTSSRPLKKKCDICARSNRSYGGRLIDLTLPKIAYYMRVWFWLTVILAGSRSLKWKVRKSCLDHIFLWWNNGSSYFTQMLHFTLGFVSILTKGLLDKFKATGRKHAKFMSGLYLSNGKKFLLYINIVFAVMVW